MIEVIDAKQFSYECPRCPEGQRTLLRYADFAVKVGNDKLVRYRCQNGHERFVASIPIVTPQQVEAIKEKYADRGIDPLPVWFATPRA
jgi:hypothetical protein